MYTTFSNNDFIRERDIRREIYKCVTVHTIMTMNIKISKERWLLPTIACHSCTLCSLSMLNASVTFSKMWYLNWSISEWMICLNMLNHMPFLENK